MTVPSIANSWAGEYLTCQQSRNFAFDCDGGNVLYVWAFLYGCSGSYAPVPTVTYASAACTSLEQTATGWSNKGGLYRKVGPASGSNNITIAGGDPGDGARFYLVAVSIEDYDSEVTHNQGSLTTDLGSAVDASDLSLVFIEKGSGTATWTDLAGQTNVYKREATDRLYAFSWEVGEDVLGWTGTAAQSAAVAIRGEVGGNKMILMMSEIYDRIQENRKKLGVGDLGNFGLSNGIWKPRERVITI